MSATRAIFLSGLGMGMGALLMKIAHNAPHHISVKNR